MSEFLVKISLIAIVIYAADKDYEREYSAFDGVFTRILIYNPRRRREFWRFFTYAFIHKGWFDLIKNVFSQITLAIPLTTAHKPWKVQCIYLAGVIGGSLGTSIISPNLELYGATAGVYSLISANVSSIILVIFSFFFL